MPDPEVTASSPASPSQEILNEAEKTNPDLIVLGNKGTSGVTRFLLGSTAERIVRYAKCSVLVVRMHP
jgi:nucleotide-binding universal stress UspA family protein